MNHIVTIKCMGLSAKFLINDPEEYIQKTIYETNNFYEYDMLMDIWGRLFPGDLFVDVGANIGNHTVFVSKIAKANVVAFEPFLENFQHLLENVKINCLQSKVLPHNLALSSGSWNGDIRQIDSKNKGKVTVVRNKNGATIVRSLDSVLSGERVKIIKIDVEGSELSVIRGSSSIIKESRPFLYVECETPMKFNSVCKHLSCMDYLPIRRFNYTPTYLFAHHDGAKFFNFL